MILKKLLCFVEVGCNQFIAQGWACRLVCEVDDKSDYILQCRED